MPGIKKNKRASGACIRKADSGSIRRNFVIEPILSYLKKLSGRLNKIKKEEKAVLEKKTTEEWTVSVCRDDFSTARRIIRLKKKSIISTIFIRFASFLWQKLREKTQGTRLGYDLEKFSFESRKKAKAISEKYNSFRNDFIYFFRISAEIFFSLGKATFSILAATVGCVCAFAKKAIRLFSASSSEKKEKQKLKQLSEAVSELEEQDFIPYKIANDLKKVIIGFSKLKNLFRKQKFAFFSASGIALIVIAVVATNLLSLFFLPNNQVPFSQAATFHWTQNVFISASSTAIATHTNNQTGWQYYQSKDANVNITPAIATGTPVVYWKLDGNANDSVGSNNGTNNGAISTAGASGTAMYFDGDNDYVSVPDNSNLDLGSNFTISAWVKKDEDNRYQTIADKGSYTLGIGSDGKPFFSISSDTGTSSLLGNSPYYENIDSFAVHNGSFYAGLNGDIYRYSDNTNSWTLLKTTDPAPYGLNAIVSMFSYDNLLYAFSIGDSKVYTYNDKDNSWKKLTWLYENYLPDKETRAAVVYNNEIYAGFGQSRSVYKYKGEDLWESVFTLPSSGSFNALTVYNGKMYVGGGYYGNGKIWSYDDVSGVVEVGSIAGGEQVTAMAEYNGSLYIGFSNITNIYRYDGGTTWTDVGTLSGAVTVSSLVSYDGKLYAGSYNANNLYRYDGGTTWTVVSGATFGSTSFYKGKLFGTNSSNGAFYSYGLGTAVYSTKEIGDNWTKLTAVCNSSLVKLYVDGELVGTSSISFPLENSTNGLLIGKSYGSHIGGNDSSGEENFQGSIDEVKIYNANLTDSEVAANYALEKNLFANNAYLTTTVSTTTETSDTDFLQGATSSTSITGTGDDAYLSLGYNGSAQDTTPYFNYSEVAYDDSPYNFGGSATVIYRSVGVGGENEIASGSASKLLTIDGSGNLTFSGTSMPDRVGVGDVVVFDSDNSNTITAADDVVFVHGRTSNSVYTVKTEDGVNTATTTAGNDTWFVYRAYTSLNNAENSTNNTSVLPSYDSWSNGKDLVSANQIWNIACYGDAADTNEVAVDGWITSSDNYIRIYTPYLSSEVGISQRHNGFWDDSKYRLRTSSDWSTMYILISNVIVDGLQMIPSASALDYRSIIQFGSVSNVRITNNIFKGQISDANLKFAIGFGTISASDIHIANNLFYDFINWASIYFSQYSEATANIYNNTFVNSLAAVILSDDSSCLLKNNLSVKMLSTDYFGNNFSGSVNNAYSNDTDPGSGGLDISSYASTTIFINPANNDFRLKEGSPVIGQGADLSSDVNFSFSTDFQKEIRSGSWDIGADEYSDPTIIYRSVGVGGTNELASGTASKLLTINSFGSTTFSGINLPDRVGVGDVIVYDSDDDNDLDANDKLVFIHRRSSSAFYIVRTESGRTPSDITTNNDTWAIYRAYTSLANAENSTNNTSILPSYDTWSGGKDLTTANQIWNIACYGDEVDVDEVAISGWTTAQQNYLRVYTPYLSSEVGVRQRHNGKWNKNRYTIQTSANVSATIDVNIGYVTIEGLQIQLSTYNSTYKYGIRVYNGSYVLPGIVVNNNIVREGNNSSNDRAGIAAWTFTYPIYIFNNIVYGVNSTDSAGIGISIEYGDINPPAFVYNNTVADCYMGISSGYKDARIFNNLSFDNFDDYGSTFDNNSNYNAYYNGAPGFEDGGVNNADGLNLSAYSTSTIFADPANNDYRLARNSPVINQGTDLSSNPDLAFSDDIDNRLRPFGANWDVGADEYGGYYATGTFTSQIKDSGSNFEYGIVSWTQGGYIDGYATSSFPTSTTLYVKVRTSNSPTMVGAADWSDCNPVWSGYDISNNNCVTDGDRYFQYRVEMTSDLIDTTPTFSDIEIGYEKYPVNRGIVSSPYNSNDVTNVVAGISWEENVSLPTGTAVSVYVRSGADSSGLSSASWTEVASSSALGFLTSGCVKNSGVVTCGIAAVPANLKDGVGEQFIQYRLALSSEGQYTPSAGNINLTYVVNAAPSFNQSFGNKGITANQVTLTSDPNFGKVKISYSIRDIDGTTGNVTQSYITPIFEYSLDNGATWSDVSTSSDIISFASASTTAGNITDINSDGLLDNQVFENSYIAYDAYWNAAVQLNGIYATNTKIKLTITDNEAANNFANASTTKFTLDAKDPTLGSPAIQLSASTTPATIIFSATDNSALYYELAQSDSAPNCAAALGADYSDAYVFSTTIALASNPRVVCVRFRDALNNTTIIQYSTTPESPTNFMIQDTSNLKGVPYEYRLFSAWRTVAAPAAGFGSYRVYRSENGINFSRLASVSPRTTNYYGDSAVIFDTEYWYRVTTVDSLGNESFISETIAAAANGTQDGGEGGGGDDSIAPVISNISVPAAAIYSNSATIYWDTNELSNSVVGYSTVSGSFTSFATSTAIKDNDANFGRHEVTLYNLSPTTTYYFLVRSIDPIGNIGTDNNGGPGHSFTTKPGVTISNIILANIGNEEATIEWLTDAMADSAIVYSVNSDLASSTTVSDPVLAINHSITLAGLNQGTVYYFRIESNDASANKAIDSNGGNYYNFVTTVDVTPPTITGQTVAALGDTYATINWTTNEAATSRVNYGTVSGIYPQNYSNSNLNISHSITLTGLTKSTLYYYRLVSADKNNNTRTSGEYSFTTKQQLYEQSELDQQVDDARGEPIVIHEGGGMLIIDKTDKTAPKIMNVKTEEVKSDSATISWATDEEADSLVEYGEEGYDHLGGQRNSNSLQHKVSLGGLKPQTLFYYRATSEDKSGNLAYSENFSFKTLSQTAEELAKAKEELNFDDVMKLTDEKSIAELYQVASEAMNKALDIFSEISGNISLTQMESALGLSKEKMEILAKNIPAPLLSGEPRVITTAKTATIAWQTNKNSNSLVAFSPEENYSLTAEDPYIQIVGDSGESTTQHAVTIHSLVPDTLYHYQVRSQGEIGPQSKSRDFTFRTDKETLDIKNFVAEVISPEEATFRWVTNIEGNSQVRFTPYRNNILVAEESKTKDNKAITTIHEIDIKDFESGVIYKIELTSTAPDGVIASKEIDFFSTAKDDLPPVISDVKTNSALSTGASTKVQTIIFWKTNELSTGQVFWSEGLVGQNGKLTEAVKPDNNYSREHTAVITKFEPGKIYTFRVESIDSAGNKSVSQNFTVLAPKQKESVFQIIMKSLEESFGWVGNIRK